MDTFVTFAITTFKQGRLVSENITQFASTKNNFKMSVNVVNSSKVWNHWKGTKREAVNYLKIALFPPRKISPLINARLATSTSTIRNRGTWIILLIKSATRKVDPQNSNVTAVNFLHLIFPSRDTKGLKKLKEKIAWLKYKTILTRDAAGNYPTRSKEKNYLTRTQPENFGSPFTLEFLLFRSSPLINFLIWP